MDPKEQPEDTITVQFATAVHFDWHSDAPPAENYAELGKALAMAAGDRSNGM